MFVGYRILDQISHGTGLLKGTIFRLPREIHSIFEMHAT
jgi:hypothetical protein